MLFLCAPTVCQPPQQAHDPAIFKTLNKRFAVLDVKVLGSKKLFKRCDRVILLVELQVLAFEFLGLLDNQCSKIVCHRIRGGARERAINIAHWCAMRR